MLFEDTIILKDNIASVKGEGINMELWRTDSVRGDSISSEGNQIQRRFFALKIPHKLGSKAGLRREKMATKSLSLVNVWTTFIAFL